MQFLANPCHFSDLSMKGLHYSQAHISVNLTLIDLKFLSEGIQMSLQDKNIKSSNKKFFYLVNFFACFLFTKILSQKNNKSERIRQ